MLLVPLLLLIGGGYYWLASGGSVSTDDAAIKQDIVSVSAQVNGPIVEVAVRNGAARSKRGDLLFRIDPAPYRVALEQAQAQLAAAQLQNRELRTQAAGTGARHHRGAGRSRDQAARAGAAVGAAQAGLHDARPTMTMRIAEVRKAETELADARARAANAGAAIAPGEQPQRRRRPQAAVDKARLDLSRTEVRAPMDGTVANADRLQVGQVVGDRASACCRWSTARTPGSRPISRKRTSAGWSPASRRRSRSTPIPAWISRPCRRASAPAPAAEFALLPAQNANGNWVKVAQRVPVRIVFDGHPGRPMIAGLSTTVTVYRRPGLGRWPTLPADLAAHPLPPGAAGHRHHRGDDGGAAAGARHDHRQCRLAAHAGQPQRDPGHHQLGADQLYRRLGDRAADQRLARRQGRAQAAAADRRWSASPSRRCSARARRR